MKKLADLKGCEIVICLTTRLVEQDSPIISTKLVEIDEHGIWIEGRELAKFLHEKFRSGVLPKTPVFFVPFSQIGWILDSADYPSLSEKHFEL